LVFESDYLWGVFGLMVIEQDADGLFEVSLAALIDGFIFCCVVGKGVIGGQMHA
jgi:hypothetical protein